MRSASPLTTVYSLPAQAVCDGSFQLLAVIIQIGPCSTRRPAPTTTSTARPNSRARRARARLHPWSLRGPLGAVRSPTRLGAGRTRAKGRRRLVHAGNCSVQGEAGRGNRIYNTQTEYPTGVLPRSRGTLARSSHFRWRFIQDSRAQSLRFQPAVAASPLPWQKVQVQLAV